MWMRTSPSQSELPDLEVRRSSASPEQFKSVSLRRYVAAEMRRQIRYFKIPVGDDVRNLNLK